jgi:replicative DNA helicase
MSAETTVIQGNFGVAAPHDLDLERTLLAAIIAENSVLEKIKTFQADMLFDPTHAAIMDAMLNLKDEGRPINLVTLKPRFGATQFANGGTVFEYIKTFEFAGTAASITDVTDSLKELYIRRSILDLGERISGSVWDHAMGPQTLISTFLKEFDDLQAQTRPVGKTRWTAAEAVNNLLDNMMNGNKEERIPSGFVDMDDMTGGWHRSNYVVIAGRPSMGKTALAVTCGRLAAKAGHGVGIFSLEMSSDQWFTRMICDEAWKGMSDCVSLKAAQRNNMTDAEFDRFTDGSRIVHDLPIKIDERSGLDVEDIATSVRQMAEEFQKDGKELRLVIVDHMGKIAPSGRYKGNRVQEVTELSNGLHEIAKNERITLIVLSQLNRGVEGRDNKRPGLADLRESGAIEQDADMVLFPYRPAYYLERAKEDNYEAELVREAELKAVKNILEVNIAKQRSGPTGTFVLFADMAANAIRDSVGSVPQASPPPPSGPIYSGQR